MTTETQKIWLTFVINKILVYFGVFLATYGITVSGNSAELIAGAILTAIQLWNSHRNIKNALKASPPELENIDPTKPRFVTPHLILLIPLFTLTGCAFFAPNYSALPKDATTEQKRAAALADTKRAASSNATQAAALILISEGGKAALAQVEDEVDRQAIKDQFKKWGERVKEKLESGDISLEDIEFILNHFDSKLDAKKFKDQFDDAKSYFHDYIQELKSVDSVEITRQWGIVFSKAFIAMGR